MAAFLDIEPRRRSDPRGEHINVAAGVPHDGDGVGMIPGRKQGTRTVQKRLPRAGDNKLAATPGFKLAIAQGDRRDHDGVAVRAIKARDISHDAHTLSGPRARRTPRRGHHFRNYRSSSEWPGPQEPSLWNGRHLPDRRA